METNVPIPEVQSAAECFLKRKERVNALALLPSSAAVLPAVCSYCGSTKRFHVL